VLSEEVQSYEGQHSTSRPTRKNVTLGPYFTPYSEIEKVVGKNLFLIPDDWTEPNGPRLQKRFTEIMTEVME
jgi:hypothetical protein